MTTEEIYGNPNELSISELFSAHIDITAELRHQEPAVAKADKKYLRKIDKAIQRKLAEIRS